MSYQVNRSINKTKNMENTETKNMETKNILDKNKEKISAYLKWIDYTYPVIFEEMFKKYPKSYWNVNLHQWTNIFINNAPINNIEKMRESYTSKTGQHWKEAKLSEVEKTIGYAYNLHS